jgi:AraC-like DNA-binding protein
VELCTPLAGTPLLAVEGIIYRMSEGDLAVLPPAALHFECCDDPRRPYRLMWAVLGPGVSSVHVAEYSPRSGYRTLGHAVIGAGGPAAREVESLAAAGAWTRERSRGLRVALLALLSSSARFLASGGSAAAPGEAHAAVERARDFISRRYVERLSVADVAQAACLSPNYLSVLFREATGKTVLEAIHELKLAEAKARLRETDSPVKQIAFDLGFESPQYFSRFFSRETGQAPSAFRSRGRS